MIHQKADKLNKGADALSRRHFLLLVLESKVLGLAIVKGMYTDDEDVKEIHANVLATPMAYSTSKKDSSSRGYAFAYPNVGFGSC